MQQQEVTKPITPLDMYRAGLTVRMSDYAYGPWIQPGQRIAVSSELLAAYADGLLDADDDSDEPRPDDAASLQAMAREVFAELDRIRADVSAWPDYEHGCLCLDDGLTSERHEPEALLATLRGLPDGAGTVATWGATTPIAISSLSWLASA